MSDDPIVPISQQAQDDVYFTLTGEVNQVMVQRVFQVLAVATQEKAKRVHILLHSGGGYVSDGVGMYNFIKNAPLEVNIYNGGAVQSAAVLVFLAGANRFSSSTATFMIHKTFSSPPPGVRPDALKRMAESLLLDDIRTEGILRAGIALSDDKWQAHEQGDLHLRATEALDCGLIHEIRDFIPPFGTQVYNI